MNNGYQILIVDDEFKALRLLSEILSEEGYICITSTYCEEAQNLLREDKFSLVVLDLKFPTKMQGIDLLRELRSTQLDLPVIVISARASISEAVEAVKIGAFDFLEKPIDAERVKITAKNAIDNYSLKREHRELKQAVQSQWKISSRSPKMKKVYETAMKLAPTSCKILIQGEVGSGKEYLAHAIHQYSSRLSRPFIAINCASIPESLAESELFGHEKGAFTGAVARKQGRIEAAHQGTLFLDEIGKMSLPVQGKLLRFIEDGNFQYVGSNNTINVDVRLIVATNQNLLEKVEAGEFLPDMFSRLESFILTIPPLRERREDISLLTNHFLDYFSNKYGLIRPQLDTNAMEVLISYEWPRNVRQLRNLTEKILVMTKTDVVSKNEILDLWKYQTKKFPKMKPCSKRKTVLLKSIFRRN